MRRQPINKYVEREFERLEFMIALDTDRIEPCLIPPTARSIEAQRRDQIQALVDVRRILNESSPSNSSFQPRPVRTWS